MQVLKPLFRYRPLFVFLALFMVSISLRAQEIIGVPAAYDAKPSFAGSWEKDYRRSDEVEQQYNLKIAEIRRQAARSNEGLSVRGPTVNVTNRAGATIFDLVQFAELLSRKNDMIITQTEDEIRIRREGEADLVCNLSNAPVVSSSNNFGSEICGWNGDQVIFKISLPDNIGIHFQFAVSEDGESLKLLTRVSSSNSMYFDLVQYFNYYEAPDDRYSCRQTLTRGRICSQLPRVSSE